jgi:hypothetical protein
MSRQPPVLATWLLSQSGASDALIGDLHETFMSHPSRVWYWHQVLIAVSIAVRCYTLHNKLRTCRHVVGGAEMLSAFAYTVACGPTVDMSTGVQVDVLVSGWAEVEAIVGQTKLVPAIAIQLRNVSDESLPALQVNGVFHRGREDYEWGNAFRRAAGSSGLAPGTATGDLLLWSQRGYTGTQAPAALLANSRFVDARVDLFAKYASTPWVKLGEFAIARTLVTP